MFAKTGRIIISIGPEIVSNFALTINYTIAKKFTGKVDIFTKLSSWTFEADILIPTIKLIQLTEQ